VYRTGWMEAEMSELIALVDDDLLKSVAYNGEELL
jgi:hypothetical protein